MKYWITLLILLIRFNLGMTQEALQDFRVETVDGKVFISWTLVAGFTCQGTDILRSTDSIYFEEIGDIQGVCGSVDEAVSYSFIDDNPAKNQKNYYQLELGENGPSPILSVEFIDLGPDRFKVFPNPAIATLSIALENRVSDPMELEITDLYGKTMTVQNFRSNLVRIDVSNWTEGYYILKMTNLETQDISIDRVSVLSP